MDFANEGARLVSTDTLSTPSVRLQTTRQSAPWCSGWRFSTCECSKRIKTHKTNNRNRALWLILGCRLDQDALASKNAIKLGLFKDFVTLDRLGCPLEFDSVGFAVLLDPSGTSEC